MKHFYKYLIMILIVIEIFTIIPLLTTKTIKVTIPNTTQEGKIVITVIESQSKEPIKNANICVVETRKYYCTDKNGMTEIIETPIIKNTNYILTNPTNWGEITLLVYKAGYTNHIVMHTKVYINATRLGVVIELSPIINISDPKTEITMEEPEMDWVENFIKLYKKQEKQI